MNKSYVFHKAVAKPVEYKFPYNENYNGGGKTGLVDVLRGSKYFKDGRWQGWINRPAVVTINLEEPLDVNQVIVGSLEEQGTGIYFPESIQVEVSEDGMNYRTVGNLPRKFQSNPGAKIENFTIKFEPQNNISFVRVTAVPLKENPTGGGSWLFLDEIEIK
ncbi:discoidin domain-containing protein [Antarcticibacterium sp. 1MA-6-2]|nr:discoidin domain-containing protein [Antarcticibacterium sp. 1MA-6-2]